MNMATVRAINIALDNIVHNMHMKRNNTGATPGPSGAHGPVLLECESAI